ncbi:MAG: CPBP family glutamic-type intramembrane protease [Ardenticatenaceae bacterium]|nr:CPBP family glutamic-type intramembrane protease [Ardenticatenaceae bacterium]
MTVQKPPSSTGIYFALILVLVVLAALNVFLPQGDFLASLPDQQMPASKPVMALVTAGMMLVIYGGLGFIGLRLSQKLGFAGLWDLEVTNYQRFAVPAIIGGGIGVFFIVADVFFQRFHSFGALPHPPFPTSIVASATAGIGEEVIFRLFFISFWVWLVSNVIFKGKWQSAVFWIVAILSALAFAFAHFPAVQMAMGIESLNQMPIALLTEIILLNGVLSLFAAYYFKEYGFLAAVGIHFWVDIVWHVIWGMLS